jgi:hypothetical protein
MDAAVRAVPAPAMMSARRETVHALLNVMASPAARTAVEDNVVSARARIHAFPDSASVCPVVPEKCVVRMVAGAFVVSATHKLSAWRELANLLAVTHAHPWGRIIPRWGPSFLT